MSKKHFIAIAATIRIQLENIGTDGGPYAPAERSAVETTTRRLCDVFADENPRFDRARFLAACGIN